VHACAGAPSRLQANDEPDSLELNAKDALVEDVDAGGALVIVVCGGVVSCSTDQVWVAGDWSVFPDESVAATVKVWLPNPSPL
jgi:hypothetical protein